VQQRGGGSAFFPGRLLTLMPSSVKRVALDTSYATVGRKPALARLLIETAISGTDQAAPTEPELAALWTEIAERRAANMRLFVADLAAVAPLRLERLLHRSPRRPASPCARTRAWACS
jgi:hypothetical protein